MLIECFVSRPFATLPRVSQPPPVHLLVSLVNYLTVQKWDFFYLCETSTANSVGTQRLNRRIDVEAMSMLLHFDIVSKLCCNSNCLPSQRCLNWKLFAFEGANFCFETDSHTGAAQRDIFSCDCCDHAFSETMLNTGPST